MMIAAITTIRRQTVVMKNIDRTGEMTFQNVWNDSTLERNSNKK